MLLGQSAIVVLLFVKTYYANKILNSVIKYTTLFCVSCYCLNTICDLVHTSMAYYHKQQLSSDMVQIRRTQTIADIPYFIASIALYIVIMVRLWVCFKGSAFMISRRYQKNNIENHSTKNH